MAFKVNYGLKKAERDRAKKAKQEAKARDRAAGLPADTETTSDAGPPGHGEAAPTAEPAKE